jgi:hypothetical protein
MDIASRIAKLESFARKGSGATDAERQTARELLRKLRDEHPEVAVAASGRGTSASVTVTEAQGTFRDIVEGLFDRKLEDIIDEGPARNDFRTFLKIFDI